MKELCGRYGFRFVNGRLVASDMPGSARLGHRRGWSMHIVCPHCTTSYAIKLESLGANGRTVRCSRCKETWIARPEDAIEEVHEKAHARAMAAASQTEDQSDLAEQWNTYARDDSGDTPLVD